MPRIRKVSPKDFPKPQLCGGKRSYRSEPEATTAKQEQELLQHDLELSIYRCTMGCPGWHLTRTRTKPYERAG